MGFTSSGVQGFGTAGIIAKWTAANRIGDALADAAGILTNDGLGGLSWGAPVIGTRWNNLTAPNGNQSMAHGAYTTVFTWGNATGAGVDMWTLQDTAANTGTGSILAINVAAGSAATPLSVNAKFVVAATGDITKIKNLTYSWPVAHVAASVLQNDGAGNLTWSAIANLSVAYANNAGALQANVINQTAFPIAAGPVKIVGYDNVSGMFSIIPATSLTGADLITIVALPPGGMHYGYRGFFNVASTVNTLAASLGDPVYVATLGGYTLTNPSAGAPNAVQQVVARVRSIALNGDLEICLGLVDGPERLNLTRLPRGTAVGSLLYCPALLTDTTFTPVPTTVDANAMVMVAASATTAKPLVVQGLAGQTANLLEAQSSAGAVLFSVSPAGKLTVAGGIDPTYLELAGLNTNTYLNMTDGQNVPVSAASQGRFRYNGLTNVMQVSVNGGAFATLITGSVSGTTNKVVKFASGSTLGDSSSTDTGTILTVAPTASTAGSPTIYTLTGPAHTTLANAEAIDLDWNLARIVTFTGGLLTVAAQRAAVFRAPTYAGGVAGPLTFTDAATLAIVAAPSAGANVSLTNAYALWVQAGASRFGGQIWGIDGFGGGPTFSFASSHNTGMYWESSAIKFALAGNPRFTFSAFALAYVGAAAASGVTTTAAFTAGAHLNQTASTEVIDFDFNAARILQHATGALATQRSAVFRAPTYSFVGASVITNAATLAVTGAPAAGVNATITNPYAIWVQNDPCLFTNAYGFLKFGNLDQFGRPQLWWAAVSGGNAGFVRFGSNTSDGDPTNIDSDGMVIWYPTSNIAARIKADRFGLTQCITSSNYYFRVDGTALFYSTTPPAPTYWFYVARANGFVGLGTNAAVGAEKFRVATGKSLFDFTDVAAMTVAQAGGGTPALVVDTTNTRVGIGAAPGAYTLDVTGTGRFTSNLDIRSVAYVWPAANAVGVLTNDGVGNLTWAAAGGGGAWSALTAPTANLALNMSAWTTVLTWNSNTAAANLFTIKDATGNTGSGYLLSAETIGTSAAAPFRAVAKSVQVLDVNSSGNTRITGSTDAANGESMGIKSTSELITISGASAVTDSTANLLPANCLIVGVTVRVVTVIPGPATLFDVGDVNTSSTMFANGVLVAAGTVTSSLKSSPPLLPTANVLAQKIRITCDAIPGAGTGQVRVTVFYVDLTEPTA